MDDKKKPRVDVAPILKDLKLSNPDDKEDLKQLKTLVSLLLPKYHEGKMTRQPGRISIVPDGGHYRVTIEAPTEGLQTVFYVDNLHNLVADAENLVSQGKAQWGLTWARRKKNMPTIESAIE
jgi:hypothetical protein